MVVHVIWHSASHASSTGRTSRTADSRRGLLAIIKSLYHATSIGTRLGKQEVILEHTIVAIVGPDATVHHLRSIVLEVLHESSLGVIHQVVLVGRATGVLRVVESGRRRIWIRAEVVDVQVFVDAHETAISITRVVKGAITIAADGAAPVGELASRILFVVWLV